VTQKYSRLIVRSTAGLVVLAGLAVGAAGCSTPGRAAPTALTADPNSQVVKDVLYATAHPGPYPKFADIPKIPTDVPPASAWRTDVADLQQRELKLESQVAALPPVEADTEPFAARNRALAPSTSEAPGPDSEQQTQDEAEALRERATPPPPLK
jgi:hypothetical protein